MIRSKLLCRTAVSAAIACLGSALVSHARAQEAVTVTATRTATRINDVVAEVTVIDRAMLDRATGRTLVEVLAQQPGLQFASNGGLGKTGSIFIRGLEARHTLLMVDGVRVGSATLGTPSLDNLPLEAIDRIEIVRGPMSSLYGNGAFGGVVQIFTRQGGQGLTGNAKLSAGSHGYGQAAGGVGFGDGRFDLAAQVQHTSTRGVSATNPNVPFGNYNDDRDGFRQTGGSLRLGWQPVADWRLELVTLQSKGLTRIDDGPGADAKAELENRLVALSARGKVLAGWATRVSASEGLDAYNTLSSASAFASLGTIQTRSRQLSWENTVATPVGTALALVERTHETVGRPDTPFTVSERHRWPRPGPQRRGRRPCLAGQPAARPQLAVRRHQHRRAGLRLCAHAQLARRRQLRQQPGPAQLQPALLPRLRQPQPVARTGPSWRIEPALDSR